jgi:O-antigen ligase
VTTKAEPRHWLVVALVVLLPFSIVPHELIASGPSLAPLQIALCVVVSWRYRLGRQPLTLVDGPVLAFAAWTLTRSLFGGQWISLGESVTRGLRDVAALLAGLILYRLGRNAATRPALLRALRWALTALLLFELYQLVVGLPALISAGYLPPEWNYFTYAGTYRPFATFPGPTVFGGYLALLGSVVLWTSRTTRATLLWGVLVVAGLYVTETRAAWLSFAIANAVVLLLWATPRVRSAVGAWAIIMFPLLPAAVLWRPEYFAAFWGRLATINQAAVESNSVRLALWEGTLRAIGERPFTGFGKASFTDGMTPYVGLTVASFAHPHNNYLLVAWSLGVVGLVLFVGFLWAMLARLDRSTATGVAALAGLLVFLIDSLMENTWQNFSFTATLFLVAGLGTEALAAGGDGVERLDVGRAGRAGDIAGDVGAGQDAHVHR